MVKCGCTHYKIPKFVSNPSRITGVYINKEYLHNKVGDLSIKLKLQTILLKIADTYNV